MKLHANAKLGPKGRLVMCRRIVDKGWLLTDAADAAGVSIRTCSKWLSRYRSDGEAGLADRSSVPHTVPHRTSVERIQAITALRTLRMSSTEIALCLGMALSTVSAVLKRIGLGRLSRLEPVEPPNRYERRRPGELIHIDVKKLGRIGRVGHRIHQDRRTRVRGIGWEYVHVCIDDATRLADVEVRDDEKATSAVAFLRHAIAFYAAHGIDVERVMTDNGSADRSTLHALACRALGIRHLRTRPYRPRTNGKAERFIRTLLAGWAYAAVSATSPERTKALPGWVHHYNHRRPHGALSHKPPIVRLNEPNNLAGNYT